MALSFSPANTNRLRRAWPLAKFASRLARRLDFNLAAAAEDDEEADGRAGLAPNIRLNTHT